MENIDKLVRKAQYGDKDAFVELMRIHKSSMYKTAIAILNNNEDAADAMQDAYLACFRNIHKLKKVKYFKTWLTRILINKCYDIRSNRKHFVAIDEVPEPMYHDKGIDEIEDDILSELGDNYSLILSLY
ncbi:MAG: sigma-70 family RNA polymerase sigma factor [Clostridia bacterium]|nr:sigma-70 family RNA polymerase sigma factor [Clostridia bacterium]